jgi:hypothetical protein
MPIPRNYIAKESHGIDIADRVIDSLTDRFFLLATYPTLDAPVTKICAPACAVFPWASNFPAFLTYRLPLSFHPCELKNFKS